MGLKHGTGSVYWINLAQDRYQLRACTNMILNIDVSWGNDLRKDGQTYMTKLISLFLSTFCCERTKN